MNTLDARKGLVEINDIAAADKELTKAEASNVQGGTIGSASSGAGAGKVTFNPFSITRKIDIGSP